jgi:hypothetical protein
LGSLGSGSAAGAVLAVPAGALERRELVDAAVGVELLRQNVMA